MAFWTRVFRVFTSIAPRFKREYGDEAARDYARMVAQEDRAHGRGASLLFAIRGSFDALRVAIRERLSDFSLIPRQAGPDARQALRIYRREPLLSLAVVATLAIAAGPTTAVYAVVQDLLLAPLPYERPDRLVVIEYITAGELRDYRHVPAFERTAGFRWHRVYLHTDGAAIETAALQVTSSLFSVLGMPIIEGQAWDPNDRDAVIITRAFADRQFGRGVPALGRVLSLDGVPRAVTGVVEARPVLQRPGIHVFVPYHDAELVGRGFYGSNAAILIARLRDGVAFEEARAQANTFAANNPNIPEERRRGYKSDLMPIEMAVRRSLAILWILPLPVVAVFLVALLSLGGLLLARAARNAGEIAIRLALGASRWRMARLAWLEALALAVPGVALGIGIAIALLRVARSSLPAQLIPIESAVPAAALLGGAAGLLLLTVAVFATAPAVAGRFKRRVIDLRSSSLTLAGMTRARSQSFLVVSQVAVCVGLIAGAMWMSSSIGRLLAQPTGYDTTGLVVAQATLPNHLYGTTEARRLFVATTLDRLRELPGVTGAAIAGAIPATPINGQHGARRLRPETPVTSDLRISYSRNDVSADYFAVMGIPLVAGRYFTRADEASGGRSVILSDSAARRYFPEGALDQLVTLGQDDRRRVVGIVRDVHANLVGQPSLPQVYVAIGDQEWRTPTRFVLRTNDEEAVATLALAAIRDVDARVPAEAHPVDVLIGARLSPVRVLAKVLLALSAFALLLAIINIYALAAFGVAQRRREIGLRLALGADRRQAVRLAMRRSLFWSMSGLAIGAGAAVGFVHPSLASSVPDLVADLGLLLVVVVSVGITAILASWIPARRAARIDPAITLKAE